MKSRKSSTRSQPSIAVHIEELVLHGFTPGNRHAVADAVQQELVRLLTEQGISPESIAGQGTIDAGAFEVAQGARAEGIGAQVAQSIYGGLRTDAPQGHEVSTTSR